jgi:cytochrome c-type biogenesis protein
MGDIGKTGNYLVAGVFFLIGLYLLEIIRLPWEGIALKGTKYKGITAALVLGLIFGIGLGPCTFAFMAPILGIVFEVSATDLLFAISLLFSFAFGHCFVIVLTGTLTKKVQQYLNWTEGSKAITYIKKICGILVIFGGVYLIFIINY